MALFRGLTADRRPFDEFRARARHSRKINNVAFSTAIDLDVFEWLDGATHGEEINNIRSVEELRAQSRGAVRVIFAPQDVPTPTHGEGLFELFEACGIPTAFVDESLQGVSQSFAARQDVDGTTNVWFHFLCKTLTIVNQKIVHIPGPQDEEISGLELRDMAQGQSQANYSWIKPGFVLKIREQKVASPKTKRSSTSDSDDTLTAGPLPPMVELFCFGAPSTLQERFRTLIETSTYDDVIGDPYALLEIGFEELYKVMDVTVWNLADVFGQIETKALEMATNPGRATQEILKDHFTGLHNLAKHTIYLRENCEAGLATLEYFLNHHETVIGKTPNSLQRFTHQALQYRKTLFESIGRRLTSLDSRISNIIQLSFNTVTQGDSRVMQSENKSMKTIAVTTLVFLPLGTVASIFGSQFMKLEEDEANHITVSQDFWLLWVIALPLTIIVVVVWRVWYMDARDRLVDGEEIGDGHGYFGWKTFLRRLRRKSKKISARTVA